VDSAQDHKTLVKRAQNGDLAAYEAIIKAFQDMAYGYAYSKLGDFHLAQDVAQEAFVQAYRDLGALENPAAFPAWFRRIVLKYCDRATRGRAVPTVPLESVSEVPSNDPGVHDTVARRETRNQILQAIRSLPEHERAVTTLFYINGYTHEDIAGFLEVPATTVKSRLFSSRKRLKERMVHMFGDAFQENALPETFSERVLSDITPLSWGSGKECTFAGALESALSAAGTPVDYATIMGVSGLAFRVRWYQPEDGLGWCPSSPVGEFPDEIEAAGCGIGRKLRVHCFSDIAGDQSKPDMAKFRADIVKSIDNSVPVLAYNPTFNMCVVHGYEDGGATLLAQEYSSSEGPIRMQLSDVPGFLIFMDAKSEVLSTRGALLQGIRIAVDNWHRTDRPTYGHPGYYLFGAEALRKWREDIGLFDELSDSQKESLHFVSWWNFTSLVDAREAGVKFLQEGGGSFQGQAGELLRDAADIYSAEARSMREASWERKEAFHGPWTAKNLPDWSADVRRNEQELLAFAVEQESRAVEQMEEVLRSEVFAD